MSLSQFLKFFLLKISSMFFSVTYSSNNGSTEYRLNYSPRLQSTAIWGLFPDSLPKTLKFSFHTSFSGLLTSKWETIWRSLKTNSSYQKFHNRDHQKPLQNRFSMCSWLFTKILQNFLCGQLVSTRKPNLVFGTGKNPVKNADSRWVERDLI